MPGNRGRGRGRGGSKQSRGAGFKLKQVGKYLAIDQWNVVHVKAAQAPPTSLQAIEAADELRAQLEASFDPDAPVVARLQVVLELGGSPRARGSLDATGVAALVKVFQDFRDVVQPTILRLHANRVGDAGVDALCDLIRSFAECPEEPPAGEATSAHDVADPGSDVEATKAQKVHLKARMRPAFHELHLSHNGISTAAVCRLLDAVDEAAAEGAFPVPVTRPRKGKGRKSGSESKPLWLRVEYNRIDAGQMKRHAEALESAAVEEVRRADASGSRFADWEPVWRSDGHAGPPAGAAIARDGTSASDRVSGAGGEHGRRFGQGTRRSTRGGTDVYDWRMGEADVPAVSLPFASAQLRSIRDFIGARSDSSARTEGGEGNKSGESGARGADEAASAAEAAEGADASDDDGGSTAAAAVAHARVVASSPSPASGAGADVPEHPQTPLLLVLDTNAVIKMAEADVGNRRLRLAAAQGSSDPPLPRLSFASCVDLLAEAEDRGWDASDSPGNKVHFVLTNTVASELDRQKSNKTIGRAVGAFLAQAGLMDEATQSGVLVQLAYEEAEAVVLEEMASVRAALDHNDILLLSVARFLRAAVVREHGWAAADRVVLVTDDANLRRQAPEHDVASVGWTALDSVFRESAAVWATIEGAAGCPFTAEPVLACAVAAGAEGLGRDGGGQSGAAQTGNASTLSGPSSTPGQPASSGLMGKSRLQSQSIDASALRAAAAIVQRLANNIDKGSILASPALEEYMEATGAEGAEGIKSLGKRLEKMAASLSDSVARQAASPFLQARSSRVAGSKGGRSQTASALKGLDSSMADSRFGAGGEGASGSGGSRGALDFGGSDAERAQVTGESANAGGKSWECRVCGEECESRSGLRAHLSSTGHSVPGPGRSGKAERSHDKTGATGKGKGRGGGGGRGRGRGRGRGKGRSRGRGRGK